MRWTRDELLRSAGRLGGWISGRIPSPGGEEEGSRGRQPVVAVAVPEGPLLVLAVVAVHLLQLRRWARWAEDGDGDGGDGGDGDGEGDGDCHGEGGPPPPPPILLPLDPDEPQQRLAQILEDGAPDLVVCATDADATRLRSALLRASTTTAAAAVSLAGEDPPLPPPQGADGSHSEEFRELLLQARSLASSSSSSSSLPVSHICFTSGTSGRPKGCASSLPSLLSYLNAKNAAHGIGPASVVLLASAVAFDPCLSDVLATLHAGATLALAGPAATAVLAGALSGTLRILQVTHVLCTPSLWGAAIPPGEGGRPTDLPALRAVALGGERIPPRIVRRWGRRRRRRGVGVGGEGGGEEGPRLLATYGTTEACVYQTCGEVFRGGDGDGEGSAGGRDGAAGQDVGLPLPGNTVRICTLPNGGKEEEEEEHETPSRLHPLTDVDGVGTEGEIVLGGDQLDASSGYWGRPDLGLGRFGREEEDDEGGRGTHRYYYRTGDLGYLHPATGHLHVLGRISGDDGMVKINGVRVELGEVEGALLDDDAGRGIARGAGPGIGIGIAEPAPLVVGCAVVARPRTVSGSGSGSGPGGGEDDGSLALTAYVVASRRCLDELGAAEWPRGADPGRQQRGDPAVGAAAAYVIPAASPLHTLLRSRASSRVRRGCVPSTYVLLDAPSIPLTKTGKCDRKNLPPLDRFRSMPSSSTGNGGDTGTGAGDRIPLGQCGRAGPMVAGAVIDALNLQPVQQASLWGTSSFPAIGGDSLTATRVVRGLYAAHHSIRDGRTLGGSYGQLEGPFGVKHLLAAPTLGTYVDWLDANGVCGPRKGEGADVPAEAGDRGDAAGIPPPSEASAPTLEGALLEATLSGHTTIACHLLREGANPSPSQQKDQRLGKMADKRKRRATFQSGPIHLACIRGDDVLVACLVEHGCKCSVPDAGGSFPLHLVCAGKRSAPDGGDADSDDRSRYRIVRVLLEVVGVPLSAKDANRQTVLHATARSGHPRLLRYLLSSWTRAGDEGKIHVYPEGIKGGRYDWQDRWFRTAVTWAVLNGNVEALQILLDGGCSPDPCRPKEARANRKTSAAVESPMEICERLHPADSAKGRAIRDVLNSKLSLKTSNKSP